MNEIENSGFNENDAFWESFFSLIAEDEIRRENFEGLCIVDVDKMRAQHKIISALKSIPNCHKWVDLKTETDPTKIDWYIQFRSPEGIYYDSQLNNLYKEILHNSDSVDVEPSVLDGCLVTIAVDNLWILEEGRL